MLHNVRAGVFLTSVSGMFHRTVKMCPYSMWTTDLVEVCVLLICVCVCDTHSAIAHSATPRTGARQAPSVYGDSPGKNTGVGCHFLLHGNLPCPGVKPQSPALQTDSLASEPPGKTFMYLNASSHKILQYGRKYFCCLTESERLHSSQR